MTYADTDTISEAHVNDLKRQLTEANRKADMHWAAYVGADAMLKVSQERERITQSNRKAEAKDAQQVRQWFEDTIKALEIPGTPHLSSIEREAQAVRRMADKYLASCWGIKT